MQLISFGNSTKGKNKRVNMDYFLSRPDKGVFIVADGVSNCADQYHPELDIRRNAAQDAAYIASEILEDIVDSCYRKTGTSVPPEKMLSKINEAFNDANSRLCKRPLEELELERMDEISLLPEQKKSAEITEEEKELKLQSSASKWGTTLLALVINGEFAYIGSVGDSRAYVLKKDGNMIHTTSQVYEGCLLESIGNKNFVKVETYQYPLSELHKFLLVTDGVSDTVSEADIKRLLAENSPQDAVTELLRKANYEPSAELLREFAKRRKLSEEAAMYDFASKDDCTALVVEPVC